MDSSLFMKLPRELRDIIYELVLSYGSLRINMLTRVPRMTQPRPSLRVLALASACKQLRAEVLPMFYARNKFVISTNSFGSRQYIRLGSTCSTVVTYEHPWPHTLRKWLQDIGQISALPIRFVEFDIGRWDLTNPDRTDEELKHSTAIGLAEHIRTFQNAGTACSATITTYDKKFDTSGIVAVSLPLTEEIDEAHNAVTMACAEHLDKDDPSWESLDELREKLLRVARKPFVLSCEDALRDLVEGIWEERTRLQKTLNRESEGFGDDSSSTGSSYPGIVGSEALSSHVSIAAAVASCASNNIDNVLAEDKGWSVASVPRWVVSLVRNWLRSSA